jgi:uncharacterized protein YdeI (YjbR/CyaY-like superfamily)
MLVKKLHLKPGMRFMAANAPEGFQRLLNRNASAASFFESLSFTNKREYVGWVIGAKRPETRSQRLDRTVEKLLARKSNPSEK